jgi:hypothetical protein
LTLLPIGHEKLRVERGGIPYLAKNERDMGHPAFFASWKFRP